jgi:hypothetical protein
MGAPRLDEADIFNAARRIDDPAARRLHVREACGDDLALAARGEALLRAHDEDPFLASPTRELGEVLGALNKAPTLAPTPAPGDEGPWKPFGKESIPLSRRSPSAMPGTPTTSGTCCPPWS